MWKPLFIKWVLKTLKGSLKVKHKQNNIYTTGGLGALQNIICVELSSNK